MRRLLSATGALVLTLTLAGATAAQEEAPGGPSDGSGATAEAEATKPRPVADYWGEWALHKAASRERVEMGVANVNRASPKQKKGYFQRLVDIHADELRWLDNHQPEACYASEYQDWRAAVRKLHRIHKEARGAAQKGSAAGLKRIARQRKAATKDLDRILSRVSDCVDSVPTRLEGNPLVGKWTAKPHYLNEGGFVDRSPRRLSISADRRMLLRIPRHPYCRDEGHGLVMFSITATGEIVRDDIPGFEWTMTRLDCHPKGKGRVKIAGPGGGTLIAYDQASDVLLMGTGSECYWRNKGGSAKDCTAFWRGKPTAEEVAFMNRPAVPDLVGLDATAAAEDLDELGLVGRPREVHSDSVPAGEVISQTLAPGALVDVGRSVFYQVSLGPE